MLAKGSAKGSPDKFPKHFPCGKSWSWHVPFSSPFGLHSAPFASMICSNSVKPVRSAETHAQGRGRKREDNLRRPPNEDACGSVNVGQLQPSKIDLVLSIIIAHNVFVLTYAAAFSAVP